MTIWVPQIQLLITTTVLLFLSSIIFDRWTIKKSEFFNGISKQSKSYGKNLSTTLLVKFYFWHNLTQELSSCYDWLLANWLSMHWFLLKIRSLFTCHSLVLFLLLSLIRGHSEKDRRTFGELLNLTFLSHRVAQKWNVWNLWF